MADIYFDLGKKEDTLKARLICFAAFISSFIFYFFMVKISPAKADFFSGRVAICIVAIIGFCLTFIDTKKFDLNRIAVNINSYSYFIVYLYLMHINDWTVFYRWSYFVVGVILCSCALTWEDYLKNALISLFAPIVLNFFGPLSLLESIHFHAANFTMFIVIGLNIRSHFRYKKKVIELSRNLVEKTKMSALGEMAGGMSHEINNPLTVISASSKVLRADIESNKMDEAKAIELTLKIDRMVERIARIIKSLKDFSKGSFVDEFEEIDLAELLDESIAFYKEKLNEANVELKVSVSDAPLLVSCQRNQIMQVLVHLYNNAFDDCSESVNPEIKICLKRVDHHAYLSVTDNGPGVRPAIAEKIMEPFFTTKELGKGTGMGLSVSLGIISAHNGQLYHDPDVSGSCFVIKIPLIDSVN